MCVRENYPILSEAYEHYKNTGDNHFIVLPKGPDYIRNTLNTIPTLIEKGLIENVSDKLNIDAPTSSTKSISICPLEDISFDITHYGIRFVENQNRREL